MHKNATLLFQKYAVNIFETHNKVLEIAPDTIPSTLQNLVKSKNKEILWDSLELVDSFKNENCKFSSSNRSEINILTENPYSFPIKNDSYDIVISAFVVEHVPLIWKWFHELFRITKKGGHVITIAPTSWPYHEAPVDCWRIYPEGMRALYKDAGFKVKLCENKCFEVDLNKRHYPGWTFSNSLKNHIKMMIGWPVSAAYDTICVGIK